MADIIKIKLGANVYNVKDASAARKNVYYGTCTTAANTYKKVATVETFPLDGNGLPFVGTLVAIKYSNTNTYKTEGQIYQLNVNNTGDFPMYYNNAALATSTSANTLVAGYKNRHIYYMFNGSQWVWVTSSYDANTTYSGMTQAEVDAGTGTTARLITPQRLRDNFYTETEVNNLLAAKANSADLATVATSGSYNDLTNKPTIPAAITVDSTITQNGTNPVQGGAIYSVLQEKAGMVYYVDVDEMNADETQDSGTLACVDDGSFHIWSLPDLTWYRVVISNDLDSYVPTTRKINNKALSSDITLNASDVGADVFVINIEDDGNGGYTCDKTNAEIYAAWQAGKNVVLALNSEYMLILSCVPDSTSVFFNGIGYDEPNCVHSFRIVTSNNVQTVDTDLLYLQPALVSGTNIKTVNNQSLLGNGNITPTQLGIPDEIKVGSVAGKLYRNNVGGSGNFSISGNSGCIPNLTAGTFLVSVYAKSDTQSYTFRFNFGSVTYDLSTTNSEINDIRQITIPSSGTFSGSVLNGSVASGTILYVVMYDYLTPVSTVGVAAVTNRYSDLDGTPTIPTVNNGTLTIQNHGVTVGTFTANQSGNTNANITTPIVTVSTTGAVTQALDPNKFYDFTGSPTSLTLTLNSGNDLCIYAGKFTAGTGFSNLTLPSTVKVAEGAPSVEAGGVYEFSIMNNLLLLVKEGS